MGCEKINSIDNNMSSIQMQDCQMTDNKVTGTANARLSNARQKSGTANAGLSNARVKSETVNRETYNYGYR